MASRLELQTLLESLIPAGQVYFQGPGEQSMQYPCIVYKRDSAKTEFAGNHPYRYLKRYQVTFISRNPDADVPDKIAALPMCLFNRHFGANGLNHDVFTLYF
jgi:hypothetical protein